MSKNVAIIPAGGVGLRMGLGMPKQFALLAGKPILYHTLRAFERADCIDAVILLVPADYVQSAQEIVSQNKFNKVVKISAGGVLRMDSVRIGLENLSADTGIAVVHDGVRPLVHPDLIEKCVAAAAEFGAALAAIPVNDTVKDVAADHSVHKTVDREGLWLAQTPQAAKADLLKKAYAVADTKGFSSTDEASLLEFAGIPVNVVEGSEENIKITRPQDLKIAEALLMGENMNDAAPSRNLRIGHGYDAHQLVEGRKLILGGVTIPHERGLLGHSDADVLIHALCDALLGALALGDIGVHFPDADPAYRGISSLLLLEKVVSLINQQGYCVGNCDITVIAERPKLNPHVEEMRVNLGRACAVELEAISIKATSTEKMGFAGRGEGVAAHAVVVVSGKGK